MIVCWFGSIWCLLGDYRYNEEFKGKGYRVKQHCRVILTGWQVKCIMMDVRSGCKCMAWKLASVRNQIRNYTWYYPGRKNKEQRLCIPYASERIELRGSVDFAHLVVLMLSLSECEIQQEEKDCSWWDTLIHVHNASFSSNWDFPLYKAKFNVSAMSLL